MKELCLVAFLPVLTGLPNRSFNPNFPISLRYITSHFSSLSYLPLPWSPSPSISLTGAIAPASGGFMPISAAVLPLFSVKILVRSVSMNPGEQPLIDRWG